MSSELLDDGVIEMARVAKELATNLVGVGETTEDLVYEGELPTLPKLDPLLLPGAVNLLNPRMVVGGGRVGHMLLELDNVRVGDHFGINRRDNGYSPIMDGFVAERWRCGSSSCQQESKEALHDEC